MIIYWTGEVITIRDRAMKRVIEEGPPIDFKGKLVFIAGPIVRNNEVISCGPTTATRVEPLIYDFVSIAKPKIIVGKGPMYENMERASKDFGVAYGIFPGGCGALAAKKLKVKANIWPELGMPESIWVFDAENFGPIAIVIENGKNYLREIEEEARRKFERLFRMKFIPPEAAIAIELKRRNVEIFHTCTPMTLIEAANEAVKRGIALEPRRGFETGEEYSLKLIALKGEIEGDARLRGDDIKGEEIARYSEGSPYIAIDLSALDLLTPKEKKKVALQVNLVKGLMRRLWRRNKLILAEEPIEGKKIIYLDPSAEEEVEEVERDTIYVIGGVVDKGNRLSGISSILASKRNAERRSIRLFGSIIGVTNTIVGIAKILIYMFRGVPKDIAVLLTSPRRALKHRLLIEKDPRIKKALERLLERRKGLTEYAEMPLEAISRALYDLLFRIPYRLLQRT